MVDLTAYMFFPLNPYQGAREIYQKQTEEALKAGTITLFPLFKNKDFFSLSFYLIISYFL